VFQTRLEERHIWLVAEMLAAIPFAAMHLPLQFFLGQPVTVGSLAAAFSLYLLLGLLVRPLLAVFRRGTGDSLLLVALLHSVFNRTNNQTASPRRCWRATPVSSQCLSPWSYSPWLPL